MLDHLQLRHVTLDHVILSCVTHDLNNVTQSKRKLPVLVVEQYVCRFE